MRGPGEVVSVTRSLHPYTRRSWQEVWVHAKAPLRLKSGIYRSKGRGTEVENSPELHWKGLSPASNPELRAESQSGQEAEQQMSTPLRGNSLRSFKQPVYPN